MARSYKQGLFVPKNPQKYVGDVSNICYRSSWEKKLMNYLDLNEAVISWGSEELTIPYFYDVDQKMHRYYPDFVVKAKKKDGSVGVMLIEVKPSSQVNKPRIKKVTPENQEKVFTWIKNQNKWKAAEAYCKQRGWDWVILTEKELKV